jgi:ABC-type glutathione transport system ATPase component
MNSTPPPLLQVRSLSVTPAGAHSGVRAVDAVSLQVQRGSILGIAGESGCGKTQLLLALLGLSPRGALVQGQVLWQGQALSAVGAARLRGDRIAMVFQDPMTALNPYLTIATQLCEVWHRHRPGAHAPANSRALSMLQDVGIDQPARRLKQYPHQLSGGMRQRVMLAMALMCEPDLLLADEPTTALDVTVQAQILDLLLQLRERLGMAIIVVTHDMGVLAQVADEVLVMESGRVVEHGATAQVFADPQAAATQRLLQAAQRLQISDSPAEGGGL